MSDSDSAPSLDATPAAALALAIALGDRHHQNRRDVMKRIPRAAEPKFRAGATSIWPSSSAHAQSGAWTLMLTGLRVGEYVRLGAAHLDHGACAVRVPGTKTASSLATMFVAPQYWAWVVAGVPAPLSHYWLYMHWKRAAKAAGHPRLTLLHVRNLNAIVPLSRGPRSPTCRVPCGIRRRP